MNEKAEQLKERTHTFFMRVIALCDALPATQAARSIAAQLLDSAGSTDSNYRAACRARSKKEFISKMGTCVEEADESQGWLEALRDAGLASGEEVRALIQEADELTRIMVKSRMTAERNLAGQRPNRQ